MDIAETINGTAGWRISPNAVGCEVEGEMVLLDMESGIYFGLNAVGVEIWNQLGQQKSFDQIRQHLLFKYRVSAERCENELVEFIGTLTRRGLVRSASDEAVG